MRKFFTRKVKYILLFIFLISIVTALIWYLFFYRCNTLPKGFEFLEGFETVNQCGHKEYSVKGIIYNIREVEDEITFDFNLWDTENYESLYYENISVPINTFPIPSGITDITYEGFGAVKLSIEFTRDNSNLFSRYILGEYNIASMRIDELILSEEEVTRAIDVLYAAVTVSPFVEETGLNLLSSEDINAVITEVDKENDEYYSSISNGFTNKQLYRPWVLSYLLEYQDEYGVEIEEQEIIDMLNFDLDRWLEDLENEEEIECLDDECEDDVEGLKLGENDYVLDMSGYQYNNSLACLMIMQISENVDLEDDILKKYCDYDYVDESIEDSLYERTKPFIYTWTDYINSLYIDTLKFNEEGREQYLHSSNISSILLDSYSQNKLYGEDVLRKSEEREDFVINYLLENDASYLKNICLVNMYLSMLKRDGHSDKNHDEAMEKISLLFTPLNKKILELIEDDLYGASLCLESIGFGGSLNYEDFRDTLILKTLLINLYDDEQKRGIWINDEYDIRLNARFLESLLDYMEDSL